MRLPLFLTRGHLIIFLLASLPPLVTLYIMDRNGLFYVASGVPGCFLTFRSAAAIHPEKKHAAGVALILCWFMLSSAWSAMFIAL